MPHVVREFASASRANAGTHALVASRLAREKDIGTAIEAASLAQIPLVVAGDGPLAGDLARVAGGADVTFTGRLDAAALGEQRATARVALVPSRAHETFGLAALEAMAQGVPVVAARVGALAELEGDAALVAPGDPAGDGSGDHGHARRPAGRRASDRRGAPASGPRGRRAASWPSCTSRSSLAANGRREAPSTRRSPRGLRQARRPLRGSRARAVATGGAIPGRRRGRGRARRGSGRPQARRSVRGDRRSHLGRARREGAGPLRLVHRSLARAMAAARRAARRLWPRRATRCISSPST